MVESWKKLPVSLTELCINTTLRCGQSFRWRKSAENIWSCALHGRVISLRQDTDYLHYHATYSQNRPRSSLLTPPPSSPCSAADEDDTLDLIKHYFNLDHNLGKLYEQWAAADANFRKKAPKFTGVRILKQDAWEALVGFICSSNNNIARISQMVDKLCTHYGPLIAKIDGQAYHDFPQPDKLIDPNVESHLRQLGFGYRAKYLWQTAVMVHEKGIEWLDGLRNPESPVLGESPKPAGEMVEGGREGYRCAHEALLELQGVGPKVADCVCLMGLGWGESVPVDTHVWQIAQRDYKFGKGKHSSLTKATYDAVGNRFRSLWGKEAGWAHSVLFTADLRAFSERLLEKTETSVSERAIKVEKEEVIEVDTVKTISASRKRVKIENEDLEPKEVIAEEDKFSSIKRRRRH